MNRLHITIIAILQLFSFFSKSADDTIPEKPLLTVRDVRKLHKQIGPTVSNMVFVPIGMNTIPAYIMGYLSEDSTFVILLVTGQFNENGTAMAVTDFKVPGRIWLSKVVKPTEEELKKTVHSITGPMVPDFFGVRPPNERPAQPSTPKPSESERQKKDRKRTGHLQGAPNKSS